MKVTETIERECCQQKDLKSFRPNQTPALTSRYEEWKFCQHCGRTHRWTSYMDAAGSRDYEWKATSWPWE